MDHDLRNPTVNITLLRFPKDGLWIELSAPGLLLGATWSGASTIAGEVKALHSKEFGIASGIKIGKLATQIMLHAAAYVGCSVPGAAAAVSPAAGLVTKQICSWVKKRANPVNVEWNEIL